MRKLKIKNQDLVSLEEMLKKEEEIRHRGLKKRIKTIQLIMLGMSGNEAAEYLNISRHSVAKYVKKFNEGGIEELLKRNY